MMKQRCIDAIDIAASIVGRLRYLYYYFKLKNKNFTIFSNNCWGTSIYKRLGLKFSTPLIGLFVFAPDYIRLLKNPKYYLECDLHFAERSKYEQELIKNGTINTYPIGLLEDIELHFVHYKDEYDAQEKWIRRLKRINWDNLYIEFSDRDLCTEDLLEEFDKLPFEHKICFTAKEHSNLRSCYWLEEYHGEPCVGLGVAKCNFDVLGWLNDELDA